MTHIAIFEVNLASNPIATLINGSYWEQCGNMLCFRLSFYFFLFFNFEHMELHISSLCERVLHMHFMKFRCCQDNFSAELNLMRGYTEEFCLVFAPINSFKLNV